MKVRNLELTCWPCPSQWEAETLQGEKVYIRYRWGLLSVGVGEGLCDAVENQEEVYSSDNPWDGEMSEQEMLCLTGIEVER